MEFLRKIREVYDEVGESCIIATMMGLLMFSFGIYDAFFDGTENPVPYFIGTMGWCIAVHNIVRRLEAEMKMSKTSEAVESLNEVVGMLLKKSPGGSKSITISAGEDVTATFVEDSWEGIKDLMSGKKSEAIEFVEEMSNAESGKE